MSLVIRPANEMDADWILGQLNQFSAMYGTKLSLFGDDEKYSRSLLQNIIDNHIILVAEAASGLVGLVCGLLSPHHFNPKIKVLSEQFWWVAAEHRESRAGYLLLKEFIRLGKEIVDWITFSLLDKSPVKRETLEKLGFVYREQSFVMEVC